MSPARRAGGATGTRTALPTAGCALPAAGAQPA